MVEPENYKNAFYLYCIKLIYKATAKQLWALEILKIKQLPSRHLHVQS